MYSINPVNLIIKEIMVRALREYVIFVGNAVEGMMGAANWVKDTAVSVWDGVAGRTGRP